MRKALVAVLAVLTVFYSCQIDVLQDPSPEGQDDPDSPVVPVQPADSLDVPADTLDVCQWPVITVIDDDFSVKHVDKLRRICDELEICVDFALMPYGMNGIAGFDNEQKRMALEYQDAGHRFLIHPIHTYWSNEAFVDVEHCETSLVQAVAAMRKIDLIDAECCVVYPNGNNKPGVREMCAKFAPYGVGVTGKYNLNLDNPYDLERLLISFASRGTKTEIKKIIKEGVDKGAWVILGTHIWQFEESDILDEETYSTANLKDVLEYAKSLAPIRTFQDVIAGL